jgi:DNA excision repair protein ERCC-4
VKLPATLKPENVVAIVDTREQLPLDLSPLRVQVGTLDTGDYALLGSDHIRIERKSLDDLLGCVGRDRERFEREVMRLLAYPVRVLLVAATWQQIELGQWRSKLKPEAVIGSLLGWQAMGLAVHMVGDHERAGRHAARMLFTVAKRRYRELRALSEHATEEPSK